MLSEKLPAGANKHYCMNTYNNLTRSHSDRRVAVANRQHH